MSAPRPLEIEYLAAAEKALSQAVQAVDFDASELKIQVLEATASRFGGFNLETFQKTFGIKKRKESSELMELSAPVANAIQQSPIHPALALSALAREALQEHERKTTGAYHTDFRLASRLAQLAAPSLTYKSRIIDPACGAGILLSALTIAVCGFDREKISYWLSNGVNAADLSENSLRAALLSLASFTDDLDALKKMRQRWYCGDSLMAKPTVWENMSPEGLFDAVIGNPPWKKVKLSRHDFLKSTGTKRHYGEKIHDLEEDEFSAKRDEVASYSQKLLLRYPDLGCGEPDLYIAFTELFLQLCKTHGIVSAILPGGLIRSHGTQTVRKKIFNESTSTSLSVIDNRSRFFSIDTRFKFLAISIKKAELSKDKGQPIQLYHERGTPTGLEIIGNAVIGRTSLQTIKPDLSIPEVRSGAEWKLFTKVFKSGIQWEDPEYGWTPKFCREVDMTKQRPNFVSYPAPDALPVIEGRMVQSHRIGAKGYISGSGRRAVWKMHNIGEAKLSPQHWIGPEDVPPTSHQRFNTPRVGFCDIAGQTNERSLMAAIIPAGVVCGNKVPTILFPEDRSENRLLVWTAIANSFVFDWILRRTLTTTVNYFLLQSVPLPKISKGGLPWQRLVKSVGEIRALDTQGATGETYLRMATLRAEIDAEVAIAYGLNLEEMELVLQDFPILDRGQPALLGEKRSTVTRDTVLTMVAQRSTTPDNKWKRRMEEANKLGAVAYIPSELAKNAGTFNKKGAKKHG